MLDRRSVLAIATTIVFSVACASSSASSTSSPKTDRDVILQDEIASRAPDASNAYQIIQKLRPQMLRSRGPTDKAGQTTLPRVYLDNSELGDVSYLPNINASQVGEIRFFDSRVATTRWGTGHAGGVIMILTKR